MKKRAQVSIEFSIAFVITILFVVLTCNLFVWFNHCLAARQLAYDNSRLPSPTNYTRIAVLMEGTPLTDGGYHMLDSRDRTELAFIRQSTVSPYWFVEPTNIVPAIIEYNATAGYRGDPEFWYNVSVGQRPTGETNFYNRPDFRVFSSGGRQ